MILGLHTDMYNKIKPLFRNLNLSECAYIQSQLYLA